MLGPLSSPIKNCTRHYHNSQVAAEMRCSLWLVSLASSGSVLIYASSVLGLLFGRRADDVYHPPPTGIITIATNGYSATYLLNTARTRGDVNGDIFVVSDTVRGEIEHAGRKGYTFMIPVDRPRDSLHAVVLKTQLFDLVDAYIAPDKVPRDIDRLLYLDADIRINSSIEDYLRKIGEWNPACDMYIQRERFYTKSEWNTGTMLLDRVHSARMLLEWHDLILENRDLILSQSSFSKDQWAMMALLRLKSEDGTAKYQVCALPNEVSFVADWFTHNVLGDDKTTLTHWTSAKDERFKKARSRMH